MELNRSKSFKNPPHNEIPTSTTTQIDIYRYVYSNRKNTIPDSGWIFLAIYEIDYAVNNPPPSQGYLLQYSLQTDAVTDSQLDVRLTFNQSMFVSVRISLLMIDNECEFKDIFRVQRWERSYPNYSTFAISLPSQPYSMITFLRAVKLNTISPSNTELEVHWSFSSNTFSSRFYDPAYYVLGTIWALDILIVYESYAQTQYGLKVQTGTQHRDDCNPITIYSNNYFPGKSKYFVGLSKLRYRAWNNQITEAIKWTVADSSSVSTLNLGLSFNQKFQMTEFCFFTISRSICPTGYPIKKVVSSQTLCFDSCEIGEYLSFNSGDGTFQCLNCNLPTLPNCLSCVSPFKCNQCKDGYDFDPVTYNCNINEKNCLDSGGNVQLCSYAMVGCITCTDNNTCTVCQAEFFLNFNRCHSCNQVTTDCSKCKNLNTCTQCVAPKVLINATFCSNPIDPQPLPTPNRTIISCQDPNCIYCLPNDSSKCLLCSSTFYELKNYQCLSICGDGIVFGNDQCDDGNQFNFDGCSSDCHAQVDFVCNNVSSQFPGLNTSECFFNQMIHLTVVSIEKPLTENKVNLYFMNPEPKIAAWQQIDLNNELTQAFTLTIPRFDSGVPGYFFNFTASFVKSSDTINKLKLRSQKLSSQNLYSQSRLLQSSTSTSSTFSPELYEFILLEVMFSPDAPGSVPQPSQDKESLNHQTMSLSFDPKLSQRSVFTRSASPLLFTSSFTLKADDNQVIQYHDESYFKQASQIEFLSFVVGASCVVLMVIGLVSFCVDGRNSKQMLIALETSFVVQLTYFSLLGVGEVNPLFVSMATGLKFASGYDLMLGDEGVQSFRDLQGIGVTSVGMLSNVNLSFVVVVVCMVVGGILLLLDKFGFGKNIVQNKTLIQNQASQEKKEKELINEISQNTEEDKKTIDEEPKLKKIGMFLVFNTGFGLFLFFLYKYFFYTLVQLNYGIKAFQLVSIILISGIFMILIFYLVILVIKPDFLQSFTLQLTGRQPKINIMGTLAKNNVIEADKIKRIESKFLIYLDTLPEDQKPDVIKQVQLSGSQVNIKLWYFVIAIVEHLINTAVVVFLGQSFHFNRLISLVLYSVSFAFIYKHSPYPASNLYRLYFLYGAGFLVQIFIFVRSMMLEYGPSGIDVGRIETSLGVYFPFSILFMLLLVCLVGFVYSVYAIRRLRFCKLEMDLEKVNLNYLMKKKLESLIIEELHGKFRSDQDQNIVVSGQNDDEEHADNEDNKTQKTQRQIFDNTNRTPFFDLLPSKQKELKNKSSIQRSHEIRRKKHRNQFPESDVKINQEVTTRTLKKEIKERLLANQLQKKIKEKQNSQFQQKFSSIDSQKQSKSKKMQKSQEKVQFSQDKNEIHYQERPEVKSIGKTYFEEIKLTEQVERLKRNGSKTEAQDQMGYIYTDKKCYNVYEQFDMI